MVDATGTTSYGYDSDGFLHTEDGPWVNDTVTITHNHGLRASVDVGGLTQAYAYDLGKRLQTVSFPAGSGTFAYRYSTGGNPAPASLLPVQVDLPAGSIVNGYDGLARLTSTALRNAAQTPVNSHSYNYNTANERTYANASYGGNLTYGYDTQGQLTSAAGSQGSWAYHYDAAGNPDGRNGTNGLVNLQMRSYTYDTQNRLVGVLVDQGGTATRSGFVYDGLGRRRIRTEANWTGNWVTNQIVRYLWDGNRVIQERDGNNNVLVSYTRGLDLSLSLEGAGGIGGLLARTHPGNHHCFYHSDIGGNITAIMNENQTLVAQYRYDPFGNLLAATGPLAEANLYRFSGKEFHPASGLYYYGFRFYEPNLQRWLNRDPIEENMGHMRGRLVYHALKVIAKTGIIYRIQSAYNSVSTGVFVHLSSVDP